MDNILQTIFWVAFSLTILFILYKAFQRVPEANVKLVERLGRYSRTLKPGINFIIPFIDSIVDPIITTYDKDPRDPDVKKFEIRNLQF